MDRRTVFCDRGFLQLQIKWEHSNSNKTRHSSNVHHWWTACYYVYIYIRIRTYVYTYMYVYICTYRDRLALTFLWDIWVQYSCCSIDSTKAINSFQIQLPVWRGAVEHEQQYLKRFSPNTFFLQVPKETCYYFQPFASGDFFLFWGERALSPHSHRATKTPREAKVENVSMVPAQGHLDNNIKLALLGLNLLWHLHLPVPFCH